MSKASKKSQLNGNGASVSEASPNESVPEQATGTLPAKKSARPKKPAAKKTATKRSVSKKAKATESDPEQTAEASSVEPTDSEIQLRAYFISERRHQLSLPGDPTHDWNEARRQLLEEARGE